MFFIHPGLAPQAPELANNPHDFRLGGNMLVSIQAVK